MNTDKKGSQAGLPDTAAFFPSYSSSVFICVYLWLFFSDRYSDRIALNYFAS
jgi:hypothetical protein